MRTSADEPELSSPRIVVRVNGDVETVHDALVVTVDGHVQAVDVAEKLSGSLRLCSIAWSGDTLQVHPAAGYALRVNGELAEAALALNSGDSIECEAVTMVVEQVDDRVARISVQTSEIVPAPVELETPADSAIVPDATLVLDTAAVAPVAPPSRKSRWQIAAIAAVLLLATTLLGFALVERVALSLTPDGAHVRAPGAWFAWHSGKTIFLFPGEYLLVAERKGYRAAEASVRVVRGVPGNAELRLAKLPGRVVIDSGGVVAALSIDGKAAGQVPGMIEIESGARTLTLRAERYLDEVVRVDVVGLGEQQSVAVRMRPSFGLLNLTSTPSGASVFADDKAVGSTPAALELTAGVRRVRLEAPGLRNWQTSIVVTAGQTTSLGPIELGAADAKVSIRSIPTGAEVLVGGALQGKTPLTASLAPGVEHDILLTRAGYDSFQRRVFAEPGASTTMTAKLVARLVKVRVEGEPADAEVLVDGEQRGIAPLELELPAARHRVEVRKDGFDIFATELVLAPGLDRTVRYTLVDPRDIAGNAAPSIVTKGGITLQLVAGGGFEMGSGRREQGRRPNEGRRQVSLQRPYYLGATEVTNGQFRQFRPAHDSGFVARTSLDLEAYPATNVSWNDAVEFCNWLSEQEGLLLAYERSGANWVLKTPVGNGYRLPTEAEWEFAARFVGANRFQRYAWGDKLPPPPAFANLAGAEASEIAAVVLGSYRDGELAVAKPRQFSANALGLYDMTGNVSEWINDRYSSFVDGATVLDPLGPAEGAMFVIRGANWRTNSVSQLRLAWRDGAAAASDTIGFRVARYVAP